jgi:hypothetical protein
MIARKPMNVRRTLSRAALAWLAVIGAFASSYANPVQNSREERKIAMTMKDDLVNRSPDIHWPQGFDPVRADLFAHNALMIDATCERVWRHIIAAPKWPEWYPNSKDVRILGDGVTVLDHGTTFRWTTFGLPLESRINEFVPYSRIGWYGYSPGAAPNFYHTWYLTPQGDACLVVTDEVGMGRDAAHLREVDESLMHRGHDLWLATLKWVSESNSSEE